MSKTFTLIIALIFANQHFAAAQKIRFNDTSNVWITCSTDPYTWMVDRYGNITKPSSAAVITKDTVMDGHTYYFHNRYNGWIREDITQQQFYFRSHPNSSERLFMDFAMNVGDTLNFFYTTVTLQKIDSVIINGVYHKIQHFGVLNILEGIGPQFSELRGLTSPYFPLCCFQHNGKRPLLPYPVWFNNVSSCVTSVPEVEKVQAVAVVPNPVTGNSRIVLPNNIRQGKLIITNAMGQQILSRSIVNERELSIGDIHIPGLYFYRITDDGRAGFSGRFVVE